MKYSDLFKSDEKIFQRYYNEVIKKKDDIIEEEILDKIVSLTDFHKEGDFRNRFYLYFEKFENKVVARTFASRYSAKKKALEVQEVLVRIEGLRNCLSKNYYFSGAGGYRVVWSNSRPSSYYFSQYEKDQWVYESYPMVAYPDYILNSPLEVDETLKYCGWNEKFKEVSIEYITTYRSFPSIEIIGKLELTNCSANLILLKKLQNDKKFRKYVVKNVIELKNNTKQFYVNAQKFLSGYKNNISIVEQETKALKNNLWISLCSEVFELANVKTKNSIIEYCWEKGFTGYQTIQSYIDLIKAVAYLKLDLNDTKNVCPKDFQHWHDFYTEQVDNMKNAKTDEQIKNVVDKYAKYEWKTNGYSIILAKSCKDLINEGQYLHHCVGRMGYDKKIAEEKSLILFVRTEEETPLYTMELEIETRKIKQFYGDGDSEVPDSVNTIINKKWLPRIKRIKVA